ncbi:MAG: endonuclease/exonuclease/phosphatase family protein [Bacteroidia bacterium]
MRIILTILALIFTLMTVLPFSKQEFWWIRVFDYPRLQIAVCSIIIVGLMIIYRLFSWQHIVLISVLTLATIIQAVQIYPYTPFAKVQTLKSESNKEDKRIRLFINNVRMYNKHVDKVLHMIKKTNPDIILLMETSQKWADSLKSLEEEYPYKLLAPLDNTYGMVFYSRLKLHNAEIKYLVEDHIPSVHATVELKSGDKVTLYGLHPSPPTPKTDTEERDAEIIMVGKQVKKTGQPSIVTGDLNDVAWSHTTRLFQRISGTSDPRVGRGFFNTYNAFVPFLRFPLDHIFHTPHFRLVHLERLKSVGSDHFPMLIELSYEPEQENKEEIPKADNGDHEEAQEKIDQVK